eukprot:3042734-Amphidinium_carterae.1
MAAIWNNGNDSSYASWNSQKDHYLLYATMQVLWHCHHGLSNAYATYTSPYWLPVGGFWFLICVKNTERIGDHIN